MTPKPEREEALFQAAMQLPGAERAIFLDGACHGDEALRQRLEALLAAHNHSDGLMATQTEAARPTVKLGLPDAEEQAVCMTIGRYKLLEKGRRRRLRRGLCRRTNRPVRRRVALK